MLSLLSKGLVVFRKDLRLEFRSLYALNAIGLFAVTTITAVSFSLGTVRLEPNILAALFWVVIFFSAMSGLAHVFIREEEQDTGDMLRLVFPPNAVLVGKWLFNIVLLGGLCLLIIPLFVIMLGAEVGNWPAMLAMTASGVFAMATVSTVIAAIIALSGSRGALFAVMTFPVALPVLMTAIHGTRVALEGGQLADCGNDLKVLFSFTIVIMTVGFLLFETIWRK